MIVDDNRRVTISTIARAAGVSVPTVSRVLNGHSDVSAQTRARVEQLLQQHGYRRRNSRQQTGRTGLLDLVFNDLDSPWAVELIRGVEDVAHASGVGTVVSAVHRRPMATRQWLQNLRARSSAGVIFVNSELTATVSTELTRLGIPVVVVDPVGNSESDVPTIGATNWAGGLSATEHLAKLGHRRIGFIAGPRHVMCSRARFDGYRAGMEAAGLRVDEDLIRQGDFYHESGYVRGAELLARPDPPTAIFAASDQMALGVYEAARRRGLRVPDDVSVMGFDDLPEARWSSPPLTTIRQPLAEMGGLAARTALRLAQGDRVAAPRVELSTELILRDSTAPYRKFRGSTDA
ncbi:LacI family DNA-binding transcriptional regulator [Couchioplanes caeruleus]|uniref:LacI family DNA-binding transcriptional regulator n=1 Tax=Couchioplanes caeruleus TaxID=56438 RepID=UPI0020C12006|nr:LacI family DNA-binding transcriptional regulator [Couchioplanes caeruleus]UQU62047.1 LacI family DNA-binding transcriptional regulator [Couchioplanes caeruleus]